MKKHTYLILTALELLSLGGAWAVRHYTRRRLGMLRFVSHESRKLEAALPVESIRVGCGAALLVLALAAAVLLLLRRGRITRGAAGITAAAALLCGAVSAFLLANTRDDISYFYFAAPLLLLAALLQCGKAALVLRKRAD